MRFIKKAAKSFGQISEIMSASERSFTSFSFVHGKISVDRLLMEEQPPVNNGINYLSTGAGFLPSIVSPMYTVICSTLH